MNDNKTKINCFLSTRGSNNVDKSVAEDLSINDPAIDVGKKIIEDILSEEDKEDES